MDDYYWIINRGHSVCYVRKFICQHSRVLYLFSGSNGRYLWMLKYWALIESMGLCVVCFWTYFRATFTCCNVFGFFWTKDMQTASPPQKWSVFLWKIRNVLNRMEEEIKKKCDFYSSVYGWKLIENRPYFGYKNDNNS